MNFVNLANKLRKASMAREFEFLTFLCEPPHIALYRFFGSLSEGEKMVAFLIYGLVTNIISEEKLGKVLKRRK